MTPDLLAGARTPIGWHQMILATAVVVGGFLVAAALRAVLSWLGGRAGRTRGSVDDVVVGVLRQLLPVLAATAGVWLAQFQLPLRPQVRSVVDHVMAATLVLAVTMVAARLAVQVTRALALRRAGVAPATSIFANIVRVAVVAVGGLVVLQTLGVSITPLLTALGVGGLAVALALQDTLSNLFAGIHLLASKKIEPGDYIKMSSGEEGFVVDVNWRNTSIRALPDNLILVPNSRLSSEVVVNYHRPFTQMSVLVQVGVAYDSDLD
ncbi:MAG: mechanosensitive ion channel family protein [Candidatus Dormibacteria bacterium]